MLFRQRAQDNLRPTILRATFVLSTDRTIVRSANKGRAIVVVERRNGEKQFPVQGLHPGEVNERVTLALDIANSVSLGVLVVRHLIEVSAQSSHQAELILCIRIE